VAEWSSRGFPGYKSAFAINKGCCPLWSCFVYGHATGLPLVSWDFYHVYLQYYPYLRITVRLLGNQ